MNDNSIKYIITILGLCVITYIGYAYFYTPISADNVNCKTQLEEIKTLPTDTSDIEKRYEKVKSEHENLEKELNKLLDAKAIKFIPDKETFLTIITDGIELNNLNIRYFYDLAHETNNSTNRFTFEFSGKLEDINNFCTYLGNTGIELSVGEFSLRQLDNKLYLEREFDNIDKLEWYSEKEEEEAIEGEDSNTDNTIEDEENKEDVEETPPLTQEPPITTPPVTEPPVVEPPKQENNELPSGTIEERLDQLFNFSKIEEDVQDSVVETPIQYIEVPLQNTETQENIVDDLEMEEVVEEVEEIDSSEIEYILSIILEY